MSNTQLKTRLEEAATKVVRCGLCTDITATSYCLPCDTFVCNNCLPLLHEDDMDTSHRIHIITRRPTLTNGPKAVERRITPPTESYAKAASTHPAPTSNTNRTPTSNIKGTSTSLEEKSQSTYRPISIASALQPASASAPAPVPVAATSPHPRPITRTHELKRFRLFACLSSASCRLFPHFITYNAHNDATTTNTLLDTILTTCDEDVDEAISIAQRLHAGGYSFDQSEELVDAIAYIHDENVAQRMNANPQLKVPIAKVVAQPEATATATATATASKPTIPIHPHQRPRFIVPATVPSTLYERVRTGGVLMEMSTPNNGDCALYAIVLAALMPHLYNPSKFDHICSQLVDTSMYATTHFADLRRCFTEYLERGGLSSILVSYIQLTEFIFFMRMKMCQQLRANGDALLVGLEQPDTYVEKMSNPGEWLDHRELSALSLILHAPIHITALDTPVLIIHTHLHVIDVEKGTHNALVLHYTAGDSESNQSTSMTCHNHYTAMVCDPRIVRDMEKEKQHVDAYVKEEKRRTERQKLEEEKAIEKMKEMEKEEEVKVDGKDGWLRKGLKQQQKKAAEKAEREADIASILEQQRAQAAALAKQKQMMEEKTTTTTTTTPSASAVEQKLETADEPTVATSTTTSTTTSPSPSPSLSPPTVTDDDRIIPIPSTAPILVSSSSTSTSTSTSTSPSTTPDSPHPSNEWEHVDSVSPTLTATPAIDLLSHIAIVDHYAVPNAAATTSTSTSASTSAPAPAPAQLKPTDDDDDDDDWETVAG